MKDVPPSPLSPFPSSKTSSRQCPPAACYNIFFNHLETSRTCARQLTKISRIRLKMADVAVRKQTAFIETIQSPSCKLHALTSSPSQIRKASSHTHPSHDSAGESGGIAETINAHIRSCFLAQKTFHDQVVLTTRGGKDLKLSPKP